MTNLIPLQRAGAAVYKAATLEELWNEAAELGDVSVRHQSFSKGRYEASIYFKSRHGSIWAKGEHDVPAVALGIAINNARELGAGGAP
jgi:hypothetical protein